jgi:hypothetical protein
MSSKLAHVEVYSIQLYVIKFVSDFRQGTPVSSTNNTDHHDICLNIAESGVKYHNPNPQFHSGLGIIPEMIISIQVMSVRLHWKSSCFNLLIIY